jgi:hypothetical protein
VRTIFTFDPLIPLPQAVAFTLAAAALAVWLYLRGRDGRDQRATRALTALRAVVVLGLGLLLLNPVWTSAAREQGKPPVLILLDTSESMAIKDAGNERRFDAAKRAVLEDSFIRSLSAKHNPTFFSVASTAARQDLGSLHTSVQPNGTDTHIGESLTAAISAAGGAGSGSVVLVSDGRNNGELDPVQVARQAKARRFPIFTTCLGTKTQGQDVIVLNRRPQVFAAPEQNVTLVAEARSVGYQGETAQAQLIKDGKVVTTKSVTLDDRKPVTLSFPVSEKKVGTYRYGINLVPMPREGTTTNNKCSLFLQVDPAHAKVLVLEGRPTWDAKFFIQALHTDPIIEVDAIFKLSDKKFFAVKGTEGSHAQGAGGTPAVPGAGAGATPVVPGMRNPRQAPPVAANAVNIPSTAVELAKYDVVVIGRGYEEFHDEKSAAALKDFVSNHAGCVVFLRGKPSQEQNALSALEPVQWSEDQIRDIRMQVTEEGVSHPAFSFRESADSRAVVQKLPKLISATKVQGEKALAVVLARAAEASGQQSEMTLLAYQNYGQGKVVSLVGEGLWRWAFLPPELKDYAGCYTEFWTQLVRWLVNQSDFLPGQDVTLRTDKATYSLGEAVNLLAFVRGGGKSAGALPPVEIATPDGQKTPLQLGKAGGQQADFVGSFKPRVPGEYLATMKRSKAAPILVPFSVFPGREEKIITAADPELMRQIALASGGEALTIDQLPELSSRLQEAQALMVTKHESRSAWDKSWVLGTLIGLLALEWILRRRWGML